MIHSFNAKTVARALWKIQKLSSKMLPLKYVRYTEPWEC